VKFSFQKSFYILVFIFGLFALLVFAKAVLIPLSMALLLSFVLLPIVKKLENWGINKLLSAFISILIFFLIVSGTITLFSNEIMNLSGQLNDFSGKIIKTLSEALRYINSHIKFIDHIKTSEVLKNGKNWIQHSSGSLIQNAFSSSATFIAGLATTIIFTFLLLIYREGLTHAFVAFGNEENKSKIFQMLKNIKNVGKKYLSGMFLMIIILGFANSIGLWIIGIDSPFLFGFFAAFLSIVPYIGTTLGATIPVLYAFMSTDSLWTPLVVMIMFWGIQVVQDNYLSPKIVGSSVNVNALAAILSLLIGAAVWGIAGMVLFLPFAAMLKVFCEEFDPLRPLALLISNDISGGSIQVGRKYKWIEIIKAKFRIKK